MLGHVDAPSKQLPLLLVRRVEVQVEAALEDAVDVGCVRPMEEQHLSHLLLRVDLPSLLELQLLGVVVLQSLVIPDVLNRLDRVVFVLNWLSNRKILLLKKLFKILGGGYVVMIDARTLKVVELSLLRSCKGELLPFQGFHQCCHQYCPNQQQALR